MAIDSYTKFKEYCLRALGQDEDKVIKVNVTEAQLKDRIEDALKKWQDFHFEGSTQVNVTKYLHGSDIKQGYIECEDLNAIIEILEPNDQNKSNAEVMDDIDYRFHLEYADNNFFGGAGSYSTELGLTDYHITREYLASMRYLFTADKLFTFNATTNRLYLQGKYSAYVGPDILEKFNLDNWVAGTGTLLTNDIEALINGNINGSKLENTDSGGNPISLQFTSETKVYPRGLRTFAVDLKTGTYTGRVQMRCRDRAGNVVATKIVQPKDYWYRFEMEATYKDPHINDYVFDLTSVDAASNTHFFAWGPSGWRANFLVLVGYAQADPDENDTIWDSGWLKHYAIALIKWQWGNNLKKFEGVQMAGGVTLNGQQIYDEAVLEMEALGEELETKWTAPPALMIG